MTTELMVVGGVLLTISLGGLAGAHPTEYYNTNVGVGAQVAWVTSCPPDSIDEALKSVTGNYVQVGGGILCAGHVTPDASGAATICLDDDVNDPCAGTYCQDLNDDSWCGGNPALLAPDPYGCDPITGACAEPKAAFCGCITLLSPLDLAYKLPAEWADPTTFGGNWDPSAAVFIWLKGYATGNAAYAPCTEPAVLASPTHGYLTHS